MNLPTKKMPWMAVTLLAVTSVFADQPDSQTHQTKSSTASYQEPLMPTVAAYNAPAEINIGDQGDWNFFFSGSFLYWQPLLDNMVVGVITEQTVEQLPFAGTAKYLQFDYEYTPGFKLGMGMNFPHDNWVGSLEYTRVHGDHHASFSASDDHPVILASLGNPFQLANFGQAFTSAHAEYTCNLDFLDAQLERVYYSGQKLVFHTSFGMRAAWIKQEVEAFYNSNVQDLSAGVIGLVQPNGFIDVESTIHSWGIGPRTGVKMDWLLGMGFRFYGNGFADILYTHYRIPAKADATTRVTEGPLLPGQTIPLKAKDLEVNALRTHLDLETGFGWGFYFADNQWHFDLAVGYDFQVFFNQNMVIQHLDSRDLGAVSLEHGNLYMQGLNITARFDF